MSEEQRLLSDEERAACQTIAQSSVAPHSQRAVALLAIDAGVPQAGAVVQSGLSIGQLKYCLVRFRNVGLKMFPEISDNPASQTTAVTAAVSVDTVKTDEAVSPLEVVKPKKAKKSKKAKKGKKGKVKKAKASDKKAKEKKNGKKSGKKKKGKKSKKS